MNLDPSVLNHRGGRIPLNIVANSLLQGNPVNAVLEPGDATRYQLVVLPARFLGDVGDTYLFATRILGGTAGHSCYVQPWNIAYMATFLAAHPEFPNKPNEHTVEVFTWWFKLLFKELGHEVR